MARFMPICVLHDHGRFLDCQSASEMRSVGQHYARRFLLAIARSIYQHDKTFTEMRLVFGGQAGQPYTCADNHIARNPREGGEQSQVHAHRNGMAQELLT